MLTNWRTHLNTTHLNEAPNQRSVHRKAPARGLFVEEPKLWKFVQICFQIGPVKDAPLELLRLGLSGWFNL